MARMRKTKRNYRSKQKRLYRGRKRVVRRTRRHGNNLSRVGTMFPYRMRKTFTWTDSTAAGRTYQIAIGGWGDAASFNMNSLYQPNTAVSGPALIPSLTECCSIYNVCKVVKVKYIVKFLALQIQTVSEAGNQPLRIFLAAIPYGQSLPGFSTAATTAQMEEYYVGNPKDCKIGILQSFGSGTNQDVTLAKSFNVKKFFGNSLEYQSNTSFDQPIPATTTTLTSNPTNVIQMQMGVNVLTPSAATTAINCILIPTLKITVEFWNRKGQLS